MPKPTVVATVSDVHAGSTVAPCPPQGVRLDDGGQYMPSKPQRWLWDNWCDFFDKADACRREVKGNLVVVINGDATEGHHHGTTQVISNNPDAQSYVAHQIFDVIRKLKPKAIYMVRGTEAHVGPAGADEEKLARWMRCVEDEETGNASRWHLRLMVHGLLLDFQHHPGAGGGKLPWTRSSLAVRLAAQIFYEHAEIRHRPPDIAYRSHVHVSGDSHDAKPTRVIITPAFQLKTSFGHKVASEKLADIGGVLTVIQPDGMYEIERVLYRPSLPQVVIL
jgi:hypothetical protein